MNSAKLAVLIFLGASICAAEVKVGDSLADVRLALGVPHGDIHVGSKQVLYFDRGSVEFHQGAATQVSLLSDSEFAAFTARRNAESAEFMQRNVEGEALKAHKLADASFTSAPYSYQLAYWQNFAIRYPGVSVADELAQARSLLMQQAATEARLAELESRMDDVESIGDRPIDRYTAFDGPNFFGGDCDYYQLPLNYRHHRAEQWRAAMIQHHSARSTRPDYNPYRWNPSPHDTSGSSHNGIYNFPTYPFGTQGSTPGNFRSGHHGRF